ncbi:MAG: cell division protein FtsW [candidate division Zixibacteria bacterium]|nr:cell division protein FtsW [candidate division Zixibacteria bacterium]
MSAIPSTWTAPFSVGDAAVASTPRVAMPKADRWIWMATMALMGLGTVMVLSASVMIAEKRYGAPGFFWKRQVIWWVLAALLMLALSRFDYRRLRKSAPALLLVGLIGLIVVLFSPPVNGAHRWIPLGWFNLQPFEAFRLAMILYAAAFLAKRGEELTNLKRWIPLMVVLVIASGLLLLEPEFSGVLTTWATIGIMLIAAGARWRHLMPAVVVAVLAAVILVFGLGYKKARVDDWENGLSSTGGSYQVQQSKIAIGSGGLIGKGLGNGRAKMLYLPEPHTDFILATVGEELGLAGMTGVLLAFAILVFRGWKVASRAPDRFGYLLVIGIGGSLLVNAGLNAAVVTGISPATGLPLPFVSYGGSSLLCTAVAWGVVLNVSRFRESSW